MSIDNAMATGRSRCPLPIAALLVLAIGLIGGRANAQLRPAAAFASLPSMESPTISADGARVAFIAHTPTQSYIPVAARAVSDDGHAGL